MIDVKEISILCVLFPGEGKNVKLSSKLNALLWKLASVLHIVFPRAGNIKFKVKRLNLTKDHSDIKLFTFHLLSMCLAFQICLQIIEEIYFYLCESLETRLSKSRSYVESWEVSGIVNRRIGSWIVKSYIIWEKKHIGMLNNHINYTFIHKFAFIWYNYYTSPNPFVSII